MIVHYRQLRLQGLEERQPAQHPPDEILPKHSTER